MNEAVRPVGSAGPANGPTPPRSALSADIARARDVEAMMNTAGWKAYEALVNQRIGELTRGIFEPTPDGGTLKAEHTKGLIYGLIMARDWPSAIVKSLKDTREALRETE